MIDAGEGHCSCTAESTALLSAMRSSQRGLPWLMRLGRVVFGAAGAIAFGAVGCQTHAATGSALARSPAPSSPTAATRSVELAIMKSSYVKDEKRGALPSPTNLPACPIRVDTKVPAPHHFDNWAAFEQEPKPQWAGMVDAPLNSASCGEWCLVVINYSYSVVLSRVSEGGFEVYMLGLGEPEGLCSGCTPGNYCRRDLVIEPRDGALLLALNSDRTEVTEDGLG